MSSAYDIVMSNRKEIVDKLIAQMEKGYAATRSAWNACATGRPYNPASSAVYKGGNRFRLMFAAEENGFSDPRWMTFKQAAEKNYKISPGSKGVLLEKWIFHKDVPKLDEFGKPVIGADGRPETERVMLKKPIVNYFRVFNGEQIIGLPKLEHKELTEDSFSKMADVFEKSSQCPISYEKQNRAYYSSREDKIHLPLKESFKNNAARLSVLLHEMAHSTGHETRLNRPLGNGFGSIEYAKEELNAELSSVFLESELGITMEADSELLKDHSNYVKSWIAVLKDNPNELFVACANADRITEYLMENYEKQLEQNMEVTQRISRDIEKSGFKACPQLIENIRKFEQLEGRQCSMKELAELKRNNPNFANQPEKKRCFEAIVAECQEQEIGQGGQGKNMPEQNTSFLKQEMVMEQMQIMSM